MSDSSGTLDAIRRLLGEDAASHGPTFAAAWRRYFRAEGRKNDTARDIERRGRLLCAFLGDDPALSFTAERAEDYRELRRDEKRNRELYGKAGVPFRHLPRPATVNREIECAKRALEWCLEQRPPVLAYNPLASAKAEPERNIRKSRLGGEEDVQRILGAADPTERAALLLYVDAGARRAEVLSLQWSQIFMGRDSRGRDQPVIQLWDTKNQDNRRIGISWRAYEAIQALPRLDRHVFPGRVPGAYGGREAPVRPGTHLGPDAFLRRMKRLFVRAGVTGPDGQPLRIHDLRHTFAYFGRVIHRAAERALMAQGGWKTRSAFDRYGISDDDERALLYDQINKSIEREESRVRRRK